MNTQAPAHIAIKRPRDTVSRDCGPEGCQIDWLASRREEVELDVMEFTRKSMELGWGDGLPLIPPTEGRVRAFLAASNYYPDQIVALLPPMRAECTVEKIAINAVMAGRLSRCCWSMGRSATSSIFRISTAVLVAPLAA
jgi:hypothetical protein